MSVSISSVLSRVGSFVSDVPGIGHLVSGNAEFELSHDGETVYSGSDRYEYVGFCDCGDIPDFIGSGTPGRCVGYVRDESGIKVWRLDIEAVIKKYILVGYSTDCADIYCLVN